MAEEQNEVQNLRQRLADLQKRQELFNNEMQQIKSDIDRLKKSGESFPVSENIKPENPVDKKLQGVVTEEKDKSSKVESAETRKPVIPKVAEPDLTSGKEISDLERFIGENLINKIGIVVTIIGVAIGAKYAIDHQLVSPVMRIVLGYLVGVTLLLFALRLKKKYGNFSSVLLSGSMAIMYFITYAAYSFYNLYPQLLTFILMILFTVFTVSSALRYNREIIAIIGLVGAYAIPFLLSEGSDKVAILYSYITIINAGILIISVKKYWKPLYFSAFLISWLIYFSWYLGKYQPDKHFEMAMIFLFLFFVTFYVTFLSYKLIRKEKFNIFDIFLLLLNSFIFYGIGYSILKHHQPGEHLAGLFTLGNAFIHLTVSIFIYRNKLADRNLFYFISGLFVAFITIAIPVQLNGNWVTLLWICEATVLFYIGRTRFAPVYEYISYPLVLIAFFSIVQDLVKMEHQSLDKTIEYSITPVFNIQFLTSLIFIAGMGIILYHYFSKKYEAPLSSINPVLHDILKYLLPVLLLMVVYLAFSTEISAFWNHLFIKSEINFSGNNLQSTRVLNYDLNSFKTLWLINYSLSFFAILSFINTKRIKDSVLGIVIFWFSAFTLLVFLLHGLYILSDLREHFLTRYHEEYFHMSSFYLLFRYLCFIFAALLIAATNLWVRKEPVDDYYKVSFSLMFHIAILWVLSSEVLNIMDILGNTHSYKFSLSILWGVYALLLIVLGIISKKKYLRISGMVLFGITLAKLVFYDITNLDTILKTILFLALGFLMLIVSFLYNKYKIHLFGEDTD
jgi:uncharacterized membrane protein